MDEDQVLKRFRELVKALKTPEALIHLMTIEEQDIPPSKQILFEKLFPVIKELILQVTGKDEN